MEWIQNRVRADTDTYAKRAIPLFKPTEVFATHWARLAKEMVTSDYKGPMIFEVSDERIERGWEVVERFENLLAEARSSPDEFGMKHALRSDDSDLH